MNKQSIILALILLLVACTPTPTAVLILPSPALDVQVIASATAQPQAIIPATEVGGPLWLQILSPQDEAVVNTPQVEVIGSAPVGAVVTVNDDILIVKSDGRFKSIVSLEEGPNLIEILASDEDGNETSLLLTITYEP